MMVWREKSLGALTEGSTALIPEQIPSNADAQSDCNGLSEKKLLETWMKSAGESFMSKARREIDEVLSERLEKEREERRRVWFERLSAHKVGK